MYENQATAAGQYGSTAPGPMPGLGMLAERVNEARSRVSAVSQQINSIALGLHGPRPEPVGTQAGIGKQQDSMRGRIEDLLSEIGMLESAVQSLIR